MANSKTLKQLAEDVFNTHPGKAFLAVLKSDYVDKTAVGETNELTMYKLGQKEFVQSLISVLNEPDELEQIIQEQQDQLS